MRGTGRTVTVVGIDEAGYGPLLGPLVVSAVIFRCPAEQVEANWWSLLADAVAARPRVRQPKIVVTDSKKLSARDDGLRWLERGVLTFLASPDGRGNKRTFPPTLRGLVGQLNRDALSAMKTYPWYAEADINLPTANARDEILTQRNALGAAMHDAGIEFVAAGCEILPEGHFNRLVGTTRNKSVVLLGQTIRLIHRAAEIAGGAGLHVFIDKQGGRQNYGRPLMTAFDDAHLEIIEETDTSSAYRLVRHPAPWTVRFAQGGETRHLPIALASMFSKYVRELFMRLFNTFWAARMPGVTPTAGYYEDGQRFLRDIEPALRTLNVERSLLVRER